jgi:hypothetical protein
VDPVPDPLFLIKSGRAGNRTGTSGSVARNCDHYTTDAVDRQEYGGVKYDECGCYLAISVGVICLPIKLVLR